MKSKFSKSWLKSKQPRKQRKYRLNAPNHLKSKLVCAHLDKGLKKQYNKRSLRLVKGDEVEIMRGNFKKQKGKVEKVDIKKTKIYIENIKVKKSSGQEVQISIEPSNVKIIKLNLIDEKRKKKILVMKNDN